MTTYQTRLSKKGTINNDNLQGTTSDDQLYGLAGKDSLMGYAGNDLLDGGAGDDKLWAGTGNDTLNGIDGNDYLDGEAGNDSLDGGIGNDSLWGGLGADTLKGGEGNDYLDASDGTSNDSSINSLSGGAGDDRLFGIRGNDILQGDSGNDYLDGDAGNDVLSGGTGVDSLWGGFGADTLNGDDGNDYLDAGTNVNDASNDQLNGGAGNDTLAGSYGNDTLDGGAGIDTLIGGYGNDVYYINSLDDVIQDDGGIDTVRVAVNGYKVPSTIENISYNAGIQALPYFINTLDSGYHWGLIGQAKTLNYSFVTNGYDNITTGISGFKPYTETQKIAVRQALQAYSNLSNITFVEKTDSTTVDLRFFRDDLSSAGYGQAGGYTWYPNRGDVHIHSNYGDTELSKGKYGFELLLHEIGHALGLKHPFETPKLTTAEDNNNNTVMSYTQTNKNWAEIPRMFDIATIQYLYGVNPKYNAGNNTYRFSDTSHYIGDGAGTDTFSASDQIQAVTLNLTAGSWNYAGSQATSILSAKQSFIGYTSTIENAIGGIANDSLTGNSSANHLQGGEGNDTLTGGAGADTLEGGKGKDSFLLTESSPTTDIVKIVAGDSLTTSFDTVTSWQLAKSNSTTGIDKLDLPYTSIKANVTAVNGTDVGIIRSHHIVNGLISFDDNNTYQTALTLTSTQLTDVFNYLRANITTVGSTVVFNALNNSYVFQETGSQDIAVQLSAIKALGLSTTGLIADTVWLV